MDVDEAKSACRLGEGDECCAFLVMSATGFECIWNTPSAGIIFKRLQAGTMNAKGTGQWEGCHWATMKEAK